jgi:hypothetical protein
MANPRIAACLCVVAMMMGSIAGCASITDEVRESMTRSHQTSLQRPPGAVIVDRPSCTTVDVVAAVFGGTGGLSPAPQGIGPAEGTIPASFDPLAVVVCSGASLGRPGMKPITLVLNESRYAGDLTSLLAVLDRPSAQYDLSVPGPCQNRLSHRAPVIWLTDDLGRAARVAQPLDTCGYAEPEVVEEVSKLTTEHSIDRVYVLAPQQ